MTRTFSIKALALSAALFVPACPAAGSDDAPDAGPPPAPGCDPTATGWTIWVTDQAADIVTVLRVREDAPLAADVLATISVGRSPHNIAFTPDRRFAYLANLGTPPEAGTVSVIDTATYQVVATVPAGVKAHGVQVAPGGDLVFVANVTSNDVTVIDTASNVAEATTIAVGQGPAQVAFTPDGLKAYVSNGTSGTTSVIDVASRTVSKTLTTGLGAMGLAMRPGGQQLIETEGLEDRISVIDPTADVVVAVLTMFVEPHDVAYAGHEFLVTNRGGDSLVILGTENLLEIGSIAVAGRPDLIGISPDCSRAYLTLRDQPAVAVIDLSGRMLLGVVTAGSMDVHGVAVLRDTE